MQIRNGKNWVETMEQILAAHRLADHFGNLALSQLAILRHNFPIRERLDVQAAILEYFTQQPGHQFSGCRLRGDDLDFRFPNLLEEGERGIALAPPVYSLIDLGDGEIAQCLVRGLWLDRWDGTPYGMLMETNADPWRQEFRVEIAVPPGQILEAFAKSLLDKLIEAGNRGDAHRGRVLIPGPDAREHEPASVDFRRLYLPAIGREDIVLDQQTIDLFERNTLGFIAQSDSLLKLGFSGRKGVLLYGPPGTGKTLLIRYLVSQLSGYTRFILTPDGFAFFGEIMKAARKMSPALIVIEDVDLIAEDRNECAPGATGVLNRLLNEMDGLTGDARMLFVLTTNRPEALEPALASRPGRIDQAIEVGLPADRERRLLLQRFSRFVSASQVTITRVSQQTGAVSPAFLKELVRRASQVMLENNGATLEMAHFESALSDMVRSGGKVGAALVGAKGIGF